MPLGMIFVCVCERERAREREREKERESERARVRERVCVHDVVLRRTVYFVEDLLVCSVWL